MEFKDRVFELRKDRGLTQEDLADALGLTKTAIGAWEHGRAKPRLDKLDQLASVLGTTSYWLMNGDGPQQIQSRAASATVPLRVIGDTCMGDGDEQPADAVAEVPEGVASRHPGLFVVHGVGQCCNRRFPEDAALGIDPEMTPANGDAVLVRDEARGSYVHVLFRGSAGTVMLSADSYEDGWEDIVIAPDDPGVSLLGVVVWWQAFSDVVR